MAVGGVAPEDCRRCMGLQPGSDALHAAKLDKLELAEWTAWLGTEEAGDLMLCSPSRQKVPRPQELYLVHWKNPLLGPTECLLFLKHPSVH